MFKIKPYKIFINIATLCPNHHTEVTYGEHKSQLLYAIWWRVYKDGSFGDIKNNLDYIKHQGV